MEFHDFVGLGYYAQSTHQPEGTAYPRHYELQQLPSVPNTSNRDNIYIENSRHSGVSFVPETGTTTNESTFNQTESAAVPGLPPLPVGISKPSGPIPAYLQHSQMLPSFPTPLLDGPASIISISQTNSNSNATQQQQQIEEGRNKALAILKQFGAVKQMEEAKVQKEAEIGRRKVLAVLENQKLQSLSSKDGFLLSLDALPPEEWARRRRVCFETLQQKYQSAIFRNFEYVARVGEERLKAQAKQLQDTERYHSEMEAYHAQVMQDRAKAYAAVRNKDYSFTVAGIGTQQRQKAERKRKRNQGQDASSVAMYVSNLPKDGSASEELMQALFGSYGNLRKIHFYMDKRTGKLKGDALVIYNTNVDDDRSQADVKASIVEAVCSQMNGAELSCGTCIKVEPADPMYQLRKKNETPNYYGNAGTTSQIPMPAEAIPTEEVAKGQSTLTVEEGTSKQENGGGDEDDLDDFFASLS